MTGMDIGFNDSIELENAEAKIAPLYQTVFHQQFTDVQTAA